MNDAREIADIQAITRRLLPIDPDVQVWLAEHPKHPEIGNPSDLGHFPHGLPGNLLENREVGANDLDRVRALDAGKPLLDVVLDVLREVEPDPGKLSREFGLQITYQVGFGLALGPLLKRLERHEELGVEETGCIAAVIRASVLGNHRDRFRMTVDDFTDLVDDRHTGFERDRRRH